MTEETQRYIEQCDREIAEGNAMIRAGIEEEGNLLRIADWYVERDILLASEGREEAGPSR